MRIAAWIKGLFIEEEEEEEEENGWDPYVVNVASVRAAYRRLALRRGAQEVRPWWGRRAWDRLVDWWRGSWSVWADGLGGYVVDLGDKFCSTIASAHTALFGLSRSQRRELAATQLRHLRENAATAEEELENLRVRCRDHEITISLLRDNLISCNDTIGNLTEQNTGLSNRNAIQAGHLAAAEGSLRNLGRHIHDLVRYTEDLRGFLDLLPPEFVSNGLDRRIEYLHQRLADLGHTNRQVTSGENPPSPEVDHYGESAVYQRALQLLRRERCESGEVQDAPSEEEFGRIMAEDSVMQGHGDDRITEDIDGSIDEIESSRAERSEPDWPSLLGALREPGTVDLNEGRVPPAHGAADIEELLQRVEEIGRRRAERSELTQQPPESPGDGPAYLRNAWSTSGSTTSSSGSNSSSSSSSSSPHSCPEGDCEQCDQAVTCDSPLNEHWANHDLEEEYFARNPMEES